MIVGCIGTALDTATAALTASGHTVVTFAVTHAEAPAVGTGSDRVSTYAELCRNADVIISSMADDAALLEIACGPDGLAACLATGATHVTFGLHSAETIAQVANAHALAQQFVAAPLLFQTGEADPRVAVVGGSTAATAALTPVFNALGISVFQAGEKPEVAATLALAHAAMSGCAVAAMAEAFALVRKYGVDSHVMHDVITDGLFGGSDVYKHYGSSMIDGTETGKHLTATRALQIMNLVSAAADRSRVPLPSLDACRDRLLGAIAHGDGERDWTVVNREQARASGLDQV